ncbi:MAG: hypothetical protein FWH14_04430 [Oscillospiraceae bacterium]|nr:hypothetical protein [Oscillospiraceae bacterium]
MKGNFENSMLLTRFILRRERIIGSIWILSLVFVVVGLVPGMRSAISGESLESLMPMLELPAMVFMIGPAYAALYETFGPLYTNFMMLFTALTVGLMNIFLIVRHTRADEEKGRYEVVRSLPIGRLANLNAAMIAAVIINAVMSVLIAIGMFVLGDESMSFVGSMLWGVSLGAIGLVFAAVAALFCQLSSSSRGAMGYSFAALGIFYIIRVPGDIDSAMEILSLISPLGLVMRTEAYMSNHWWPVAVMLCVAAVITAIAYRLNFSRDIDRGLIPARQGRSEGRIKTSFGLTLRLLKTSLIVWIAGMVMLAASYGTIFGGIDDFIAHNDMYQQLILGPAGVEFAEGMSPEQTVEFMRAAVSSAGYTITELFSSMIINMMSMLTAVPLLMFILKLKHEERDIRSELLLATPVRRKKYLAGFVGISFAASVILQLSLIFGLYSMGGYVLQDWSELSLSFLMRANLAYLPALWVMIGLAVLIIGLVPRAAGAVWGYFAFSFMVIFFGRLDLFPSWLANLTPMGFVPQLPMDQIKWPVMLILTAIAALLTTAGFLFYSKRDVNAIKN